jgi:hypothetical protein
MLKVIINKCPKDIMKNIVNNYHIILTDKEIYPILNSEECFNGKKYSFNKIEDFVDEISRLGNEKNVLIHTFNPLILNFFEDNIAKESFIIIKNSGDFIKFFDNENSKIKLECMGPGEAVIDTKFEDDY